MQKGQAAWEAIFQWWIVEYCCPKAFEIYVEEVVEIVYYLLRDELALGVEDKGIIEWFLNEQGDEFSSIHVRFIH